MDRLQGVVSNAGNFTCYKHTLYKLTLNIPGKQTSIKHFFQCGYFLIMEKSNYHQQYNREVKVWFCRYQLMIYALKCASYGTADAHISRYFSIKNISMLMVNINIKCTFNMEIMSNASLLG